MTASKILFKIPFGLLAAFSVWLNVQHFTHSDAPWNIPPYFDKWPEWKAKWAEVIDKNQQPIVPGMPRLEPQVQRQSQSEVSDYQDNNEQKPEEDVPTFRPIEKGYEKTAEEDEFETITPGSPNSETAPNEEALTKFQKLQEASKSKKTASYSGFELGGGFPDTLITRPSVSMRRLKAEKPGVLTLNICLNEKGKVQRLSYEESKSDLTDETLRTAVSEKIRQFEFLEGEANRCGSIKVIFKKS